MCIFHAVSMIQQLPWANAAKLKLSSTKKGHRLTARDMGPPAATTLVFKAVVKDRFDRAVGEGR